MSMSVTRFVLKSGGFKEMLNSGEARALVTSEAQAVLAAAQAGAPVDSGEYRASIHLEQDTTDRAVTRVVASAPHALVVEAMTGNMARALDAAG